MEFKDSEMSHEERVETLLKENQRLLIENNTLLRSLRRTALISSIVRFIWFIALIGASIYIYSVYIEPNLEIITQRTEGLQTLFSDHDLIRELYEDFRSKEPVTR